MTVSLTYDATLARVRVSVGAQPVNANAFFETTAAPWTASGGVVARSTAQAHEGAASLLLTPDGVSAQSVARSEVLTTGIVAGASYRAAAWLRCAAARNVSLNIDWYTAGGAFISTSTTTLAVASNTWTLFDFTAAAPATAGRAGITVSMDSTPPAGHLLYIDEAGLYTLLPSTADVAVFERSTNGIQWTVVRGGAAVPIVAGAASLDDYEFAPDVPNLYRVSAVDNGAITFVGAGTAAGSQNAGGVSTVTPTLPAHLPGDLLLVLASIRNSGAGTVNVPADWTSLAESGNVRLLGRRAPSSGTAAPVVTFAGGVPEATLIAQSAALRNAELVPAVSAAQLNASGQNIGYPALNVPGDNHAVIVAGWKQDDWTSVATLAGMTEIQEFTTTGGDDASQVWDYQLQTTAANVAPGSFVVTGGAAAISRGLVAAFTPAAHVTAETGSITPSLGGMVWFKSLARPFLNMSAIVKDYSEITRPARAGVFDVVGRSLPVAVNDVRGSRRWNLEVLTQTAGEATDFDLLLASGDPLFIQVPPDCDVPGGYVTVGDTGQSRPARKAVRRIFTLPCTEAAPPGPDVVGATVTWQAIINGFATWADVLATFPTWADVLEYVANPEDVIVP
ncbi:hypothetical protein K1W54_28780 [Micromonospora sp. CPCC 205371]|nr:hypothetical protein [Micromonospora sp. CPCC 205371]